VPESNLTSARPIVCRSFAQSAPHWIGRTATRRQEPDSDRVVRPSTAGPEYVGPSGQAFYVGARPRAKVVWCPGAAAPVYSGALDRSTCGRASGRGRHNWWPAGWQLSIQSYRPGRPCDPVDFRRGADSISKTDFAFNTDAVPNADSIAFATSSGAFKGTKPRPSRPANREIVL
jgi:hypothetical protein